MVIYSQNLLNLIAENSHLKDSCDWDLATIAFDEKIDKLGANVRFRTIFKINSKCEDIIDHRRHKPFCIDLGTVHEHFSYD